MVITSTFSLHSQELVINEFHYYGNDVNEFIEISVDDDFSGDLSDLAVTLYKGSNRKPYNTKTLDLFIEGETTEGFTYYQYDYTKNNGIKNKTPGGIALSNSGNLVQFVSYGGTFTARGGPANGETSTDIEAIEQSTTPADESLQKIEPCTGDCPGESSWVGPIENTKGDVNSEGVLPVQWLSFSADKTNAGVELNWRVAEEVNVEKYIVERSVDARNWMPIGQVIAKDNYRIGSYNFVDKKPLTENVYYRVQEVDYDGYTEYSVTRSVTLGSQELDLINTIAENRLYLNRSMEGQYEILSIDGKRVKANNHSGNEINVSDLNSGIYILKVKEGSTISTYKFTK